MKKVRTVLLGATIAVFSASLLVGVCTLAASSEAEGIFKGKCAICHSVDGSGSSPMGKALKIPDLRSAEVQKLSDADLAEIISKGKKKMPPFKGKLSQAQIQSLVTYLRQLAKKQLGHSHS